MVIDHKPGDPLHNRRLLAYVSFFNITATLFFSLIIILFGGESVKDNAAALSGIIITALGCFTAVIGDYSHSARKKHAKDIDQP